MFSGMADITRRWENGELKEETCNYKKSGLGMLKIICEKCNKEVYSYNDLLSELGEEHIEKKLIDWLKQYFSEHSLIDFVKSDDSSEEDKQEKRSLCHLKINIPYLKRYREQWLLNVDSEPGKNLQLPLSEKYSMRGGLQVEATIKKEGKSWFFQIDELAGLYSMVCGAGYEGYIDYNEETGGFSFRSVTENVIFN